MKDADDNDKKLILCQCTFAQCKEEMISDTQRGRFVNLRTYKKHQSNDNTEKIRSMVSANQAAQAAHDAELSRAIDNLPIGNLNLHPAVIQPSIAAPALDSRFTRTKKLVSLLHEIEDGLKTLHSDIKAVGNAPTGASDIKLAGNIKELGNIKQALAEESAKLLPMAMSKIPAVVETYETVRSLRDTVHSLFEVTMQTWQDALARRIAQEDALAGSKFDTGAHFLPSLVGVAAFLQVVILMVAVCHITLHLPRRGTYWLFQMCEKLLDIVMEALPHALTALGLHFYKTFPHDIRVAIKTLRLEGKSEVYAACPACHSIYRAIKGKSGEDDGKDIYDDIPVYPERCSARRHGKKCKELLVRPKSVGQLNLTIYVPIRPYVVFDFKDWFAGLLSRHGYEKKMDQAWEKMRASEGGKITDIFQGSAIREFMGPDGKTHFSLSGDTNAGRYLFSIGVDFFNPLGNKQAGKKISVGMISVACLNLPIEERHKPENLYVQLIPGPHEPSVEVDGINPYLKPIVDAFLAFWEGVWFSRTADYLYGRLIFCAIILVVCDLPMARKVGGFTTINHELFCSRCECCRSFHSYNNFEHDVWVSRIDADCRRKAEKYISAPSTEAAKKLVEKYGIRWTELLRLPYYKPSSYLVVDPMHNLFLGLIKEHFRSILGYNPEGKKSRRKEVVPHKALIVKIPFTFDNPEPQAKSSMKAARSLLRWLSEHMEFSDKDTAFESAVKKWAKIALPALVYVARGLQCEMRSGAKRLTREEYSRAIRMKQVETNTYIEPGNVLTDEEMHSIRDDMDYIVKPSWVTSVPLLSGSKLKADEWRTLGCLNLPISLVRKWSDTERAELLHLTMLLMTAITLATSQVTSEAHSILYINRMVEYRRELQRIFPFYECVPNHHMAFHIPEFIKLYGPVHGWWAFPFERAIGQLQRLSTNYKKYEYEETILRSWHKAANLRGLFFKESCPRVVKECLKFFQVLVQPQARGILATEHDDAATFQDLENEVQSFDEDLGVKGKTASISLESIDAIKRADPHALVPSDAITRSQVWHHGLSFTTQTRHRGNSSVTLHGTPAPFTIKQIIEFPKVSRESRHLQGVWIVGVHHQPSDIPHDPYQEYPELGASIWSTRTHSQLKAAPVAEIEAHCARFEWDEIMVVVSLKRVRVSNLRRFEAEVMVH